MMAALMINELALGDEVKVFVYQDRLILLEDAGLRSVRALS